MKKKSFFLNISHFLPVFALSMLFSLVLSVAPRAAEIIRLAASDSLLMPQATGKAEKKNSSAVIDYSNAGDGYVMVKWTAGGSDALKVLIKGPNAGKGTYDSYQYNLRADGQFEVFPLSDGSGQYTVGVYKKAGEPSKYSTVLSASVDVKLKNELSPFLYPSQYVSYSAGSAAVKKAAELCAGESEALKKVEKVYDCIVSGVTYDKAKAGSVRSGYLPDVDQTLSTGKGICFDYAALMAAMLRSQDVPVKLVVGYAGKVYHAWINVYSEKEGWVDGKIFFDGAQWKLMDPTFASSGKQSDSIMDYIGNGKNYSPKYQY